MFNDTLSGNASTGGVAGNLFDAISATFQNTIIAGGVASSGSNCLGSGIPVSEGHNLEDTTPSQCGFGASDLVGVNPLLDIPRSNGGPTVTEALLPGSPAIDGGKDSGCPATDQRGVLRPAGAACDIGAFEVAPATAVTEPASAVAGAAGTLNGIFSNPDLLAGTVYFQFGPTTGYGSQTPAQAIGGVTAKAPFSAVIAGLSAGATYHFRAVATNALGTVFGGEETFKAASTTVTSPAAAPVLSALSTAPANRLRFTARVNGRALRPGHYRLTALARNGSGQASAPRTASFSVAR